MRPCLLVCKSVDQGCSVAEVYVVSHFPCSQLLQSVVACRLHVALAAGASGAESSEAKQVIACCSSVLVDKRCKMQDETWLKGRKRQVNVCMLQGILYLQQSELRLLVAPCLPDRRTGTNMCLDFRHAL